MWTVRSAYVKEHCCEGKATQPDRNSMETTRAQEHLTKQITDSIAVNYVSRNGLKRRVVWSDIIVPIFLLTSVPHQQVRRTYRVRYHGAERRY
jgi:hypothetical protein